MDIWGPALVSSNGCLYYLSVVDVCTRHTWIYFLLKNSDVVKICPQFHKVAKTHLGYTLKSVQTNNGSEIKALASYLSHHGIYHRFTFPYSTE